MSEFLSKANRTSTTEASTAKLGGFVQLARGPMSFLIIVGSQSSLADCMQTLFVTGHGVAWPDSILFFVG